MPLISIIIVTFNAGEKICKTFKSIILQEFTDYEIIVIDGGSTDGTVEYLLSFKSKIAYFVTEPDNGIYDAMNKGINMAHGQYCLFLNSGDIFYSENSLLLVGGRLQNNCDAGILACGAVYDYEGIGQQKFSPQFAQLPYKFCHQSIFFRTDIIRSYSYDTHYKFAGDSELLYRLIQNGVELFVYDITLVKEEAGDGVTFHNLYASAQELYSIPYLQYHLNRFKINIQLQKIRIYSFLIKILSIKIIFYITNRCNNE